MLAPMTTRTLAEFAATVKFDDIPANVVDAAQRCIVDTVGVMIAGAGTDVAKVMHSFATRRGIARAPGNPLRLSGPADTAAVLYATNAGNLRVQLADVAAEMDDSIIVQA